MPGNWIIEPIRETHSHTTRYDVVISRGRCIFTATEKRACFPHLCGAFGASPTETECAPIGLFVLETKRWDVSGHDGKPLHFSHHFMDREKYISLWKNMRERPQDAKFLGFLREIEDGSVCERLYNVAPSQCYAPAFIAFDIEAYAISEATASRVVREYESRDEDKKVEELTERLLVIPSTSGQPDQDTLDVAFLSAAAEHAVSLALHDLFAERVTDDAEIHFFVIANTRFVEDHGHLIENSLPELLASKQVLKISLHIVQTGGPPCASCQKNKGVHPRSSALWFAKELEPRLRHHLLPVLGADPSVFKEKMVDLSIYTANQQLRLANTTKSAGSKPSRATTEIVIRASGVTEKAIPAPQDYLEQSLSIVARPGGYRYETSDKIEERIQNGDILSHPGGDDEGDGQPNRKRQRVDAIVPRAPCIAMIGDASKDKALTLLRAHLGDDRCHSWSVDPNTLRVRLANGQQLYRQSDGSSIDPGKHIHQSNHVYADFTPSQNSGSIGHWRFRCTDPACHEISATWRSRPPLFVTRDPSSVVLDVPLSQMPVPPPPMPMEIDAEEGEDQDEAGAEEGEEGEEQEHVDFTLEDVLFAVSDLDDPDPRHYPCSLENMMRHLLYSHRQDKEKIEDDLQAFAASISYSACDFAAGARETYMTLCESVCAGFPRASLVREIMSSVETLSNIWAVRAHGEDRLRDASSWSSAFATRFCCLVSEALISNGLSTDFTRLAQDFYRPEKIEATMRALFCTREREREGRYHFHKTDLQKHLRERGPYNFSVSRSLTVCHSAPGTGKTAWACSQVHQLFRSQGLTLKEHGAVIWITPQRIYTYTQHKTWSEGLGVDIDLYINVVTGKVDTSCARNAGCRFVGVQLSESLVPFANIWVENMERQGRQVTVIIDECNKQSALLAAPYLHSHKGTSAFDAVRSICQRAHHVIALEGQPSVTSVIYIHSLLDGPIPDDRHVFHVVNPYTMPNQGLLVHKEERTWRAELVKSIQEEENVVLCVGYKSDGERFALEMLQCGLLKTSDIKLVFGADEGASSIRGGKRMRGDEEREDEAEDEQQQHQGQEIEKQRELIRSMMIQKDAFAHDCLSARLVVISPALTVGASFEHKHFHRLFVHYKGKQTCPPDEVFQQAWRVRNIQHRNEMQCFFGKPSNGPYRPDPSMLSTDAMIVNMRAAHAIRGRSHMDSVFMAEHVNNELKSRDHIAAIYGLALLFGYKWTVFGQDDDAGDERQEERERPGLSQQLPADFADFRTDEVARILRGEIPDVLASAAAEEQAAFCKDLFAFTKHKDSEALDLLPEAAKLWGAMVSKKRQSRKVVDDAAPETALMARSTFKKHKVEAFVTLALLDAVTSHQGGRARCINQEEFPVHRTDAKVRSGMSNRQENVAHLQDFAVFCFYELLGGRLPPPNTTVTVRPSGNNWQSLAFEASRAISGLNLVVQPTKKQALDQDPRVIPLRATTRVLEMMGLAVHVSEDTVIARGRSVLPVDTLSRLIGV
jgi:hypothetical protein